MLMAGGELSFRIRPVCESCAASITIRQRIGRRIKRKKIGLESFFYWALIMRIEIRQVV